MTNTGKWQYSATQWIFGSEDIETTARRLSSLGYDGIELAGEPATQSVEEVKRILDRHRLQLSSICGIYTPERDISIPTNPLGNQAFGTSPIARHSHQRWAPP